MHGNNRKVRKDLILREQLRPHAVPAYRIFPPFPVVSVHSFTKASLWRCPSSRHELPRYRGSTTKSGRLQNPQPSSAQPTDPAQENSPQTSVNTCTRCDVR